MGRLPCFFARPSSPAANWPGVETIPDYLTQLASQKATPGGGSAATIVAAAGASLVAMVARICAENPRYETQHDEALTLVTRADALRTRLLDARVRDEAAFGAVVEAQALPKGSAEEKIERRNALERALRNAAAEPLHAAAQAIDVLRLTLRALAIPNVNLASDLGCAAEFAHAALNACGYNVRINHRFMKDEAAIAEQEHLLARYEREGGAMLGAVRSAVRRRLTR